MTRRKFALSAAAPFVARGLTTTQTRQRNLRSVADIYAPVVVGRPPCDAGIGLARLPSGEIRHYNYNEQRGGKPPYYIASFNQGLTWTTGELNPEFTGADQRSPVSGEYIRVFEYFRTEGAFDYRSIQQGERRGTFVAKSSGGLDGDWTCRRILAEPIHTQRPTVFIRGGKRTLAPCQRWGQYGENSWRWGAGTFYSDDDGLTWKLSNFVSAPLHVPNEIDQGPRWQNGACESTVVELKDGRAWMLARTSQDMLYESFSTDGGATWCPLRPSRFYSTLTMPNMARLKDGRILLLWNNTRPLPEMPRSEATRFMVGTAGNNGQGEDVFTNRDALHGAISDDDGQTWRGFRELHLNRLRNDGDYGETGGIDRGVHQNQFVEVDGGKILVSVGQHWLHRVLLLFDPAWLLEKTRADDFRHGLEGWSVQKYIAGIRGHCAFNRKTGCALPDHPDRSGQRVLQVRRVKDSSLVTENDGAVWNFPAGKAGKFRMRVQIPADGQGGRLSLLDRWVNPTDRVSEQLAMFNLSLKCDGADSGRQFRAGIWHEVRLEWDGLDAPDRNVCRVWVDGQRSSQPLPLRRASRNGISYLHLMSTATTEDRQGFLIESVSASVR